MLPPAETNSLTLSERWGRLAALLQKSEPLWQPSTFHERRPEWCARHPRLTDALLTLDDATLAELSAEPERSAAWLAPELPLLRDLPALTELPTRTVTSFAAGRGEDGVSERKSGQIDAFVAAVGQPCAPLVEWCAGKGHLSRRFIAEFGVDACAVDRDPALCAAGQAPRQKTRAQPPLPRFIVADVMAASTAESLRDSHAVALHACGDLHRQLVIAAASVRAPAIDVAPCCYPLTAADTYQPLSAPSALRLSRNALKLAVTETATASRPRSAASERTSAWKLAFLCLRDEQVPSSPAPFRPVPAHWQNAGFTAFLLRLAEREGVPIPAGFDFARGEADGWLRHRESRRLQLVRLSFRRAIEVWLLCDLGAWLEQQGYAVTLRAFCPRSLTPRNLLLSARLGG